MKNFLFSLLIVAVASPLAGCQKDPQAAPEAVPTVPAAVPTEPAAALPPGHPTLAAAASPTAAPAMPPGHPPITGMAPAPLAGTPQAGEGVAFAAPKEWSEKPARSMLWKVYAVPHAEGDAEDAEVTVSSLAANIPLAANVERWCGQFELEGGQPCSAAAKTRDLAGTAFPTKVVELSGALKSGGMGAPGAAASKPGWRLLVAEVTMPGKAWYLKLTGQQKTVGKWQGEFEKAVAAIK